MRHSRAAHAVVATGSGIFALAGTGAGNQPVLEVERFDGTAWSIETTIPGQGLNAPAAVAVGDRIYLIGGFNTVTNVPSDRVFVYDLARRSWGEVATLPEPRGGHGVAVLEGKVHVIGGGNSRSTIADHTVFDPSANRWEARAPLPRAEGSPAVVAFAGKLYAIGGRSGASDFGDVYIYDPATNTWTEGLPIEPRGTAGAVVYCEAIYLFGGESQTRRASLDEVLRLRPGGDWEPMTPMPTARNFARSVVFRGSVYVVGGSPTPDASHASVGSTIVERYRAPC